MNVLYLACEPRIDLSHPVGHTTHILKTIRALEHQGHDVCRLIAGELKGSQNAKSTFRKLKPMLPLNVSILLRDLQAVYHDRQFFRHCKLMCQGKPFDFVYERAASYHCTGKRLAEVLGIPLILEVNSPVEEMITFHGCSKLMIPIAEYCERVTTSKAHAMIVGSNGMRQYFVNKGVKSDKIFIIYPTAEKYYFETTKNGRGVREQYGIAGKVVVGFVGSMAAFHRVDLLLHAAIEVSRGSPEIHFLIVGDGKKMDDLRRFAEAKSLTHVISFTGHVPYEEVPEYMAAMDICVIPHATWYGSPTKLFEYASAGKPVIGPRIGPIEELITYGENGILFEVGDCIDLARNILRLSEDPNLRRSMGVQLRRKVLNDHTWEKNTDYLIEIFESIRKKT